MNEEVIIMKQNEGRGVVIMNRSNYLEKCLSILQGMQFMKLDHDVTSKLESKVQSTIKSKLPENVYKRLSYRISTRLYGNVKIRKLHLMMLMTYLLNLLYQI